MRSVFLAAALITASLTFGARAQNTGPPAQTVAALDDAVAVSRGKPLEGQPDFVQYGEAVVLIGQFCGHNDTIW
jgi:hypothetical protein